MFPAAKASSACPPLEGQTLCTLASVSQPLTSFLPTKPSPAQSHLLSMRNLFSDTEDDFRHLRAYIADVLSAAPQHAKSRCQGYWSEGRPVARGDSRLLTGQQLAQEIKVRKLSRDPGEPAGPLPSLIL